MAKEENKIEKKEEKSVTRSKPNFFQRTGERIKNYFAETRGELRKVSWPTRREALYLTGVVLVVTAIMSILLGSFDYLFSKLFEWIITLPL